MTIQEIKEAKKEVTKNLIEAGLDIERIIKNIGLKRIDIEKLL